MLNSFCFVDYTVEESDIIDLEKRYWLLKAQSRTGRFDLETFAPLVSPPIHPSLSEGTELSAHARGADVAVAFGTWWSLTSTLQRFKSGPALKCLLSFNYRDSFHRVWNVWKWEKMPEKISICWEIWDDEGSDASVCCILISCQEIWQTFCIIWHVIA